MDGPNLKTAPQETVLADDDDREPTKEEIMDDIRIGLRQAMAGVVGRPALEVLDEIDRELKQDANTR